jgi:hypothetical protein
MPGEIHETFSFARIIRLDIGGLRLREHGYEFASARGYVTGSPVWAADP